MGSKLKVIINLQKDKAFYSMRATFCTNNIFLKSLLRLVKTTYKSFPYQDLEKVSESGQNQDLSRQSK